MTTNNHILLFVCFMLSVVFQELQAQISKEMTYGIIDSIKLLNPEPTINDDIKIIAYTSFGYSDCTLDSIVNIGTLSSADTALVVRVQHAIPDNVVIEDCHSIDTVNIGKWTAGDYSLFYSITASLFLALDESMLTFSVTTSTDIQPEIKTSNQFFIYPNPSQDFIYIEMDLPTKSTIQEISLFDISGQRVFNKKNLSYQNKTPLDISNLDSGLYSAILIIKNKLYFQKILKI